MPYDGTSVLQFHSNICGSLNQLLNSHVLVASRFNTQAVQIWVCLSSLPNQAVRWIFEKFCLSSFFGIGTHNDISKFSGPLTAARTCDSKNFGFEGSWINEAVRWNENFATVNEFPVMIKSIYEVAPLGSLLDMKFEIRSCDSQSVFAGAKSKLCYSQPVLPVCA